MLAVKVHNLEVDNEEANDTLGKLTEQMTVEREEHEDKIDEINKRYTGLIDRMTAEKADMSDALNQLENELADKEAAIDQLEQEAEKEQRDLENKIVHLKGQNEEMSRNIVDLADAKREAMEKIRGLEEEVSDADGAIDDAKAAIETLLEEKKAADARIQDLMKEREHIDSAMDQLRKQTAVNKKDLESKLFDVREENEELNHNIILLKMEKKEAEEKISNLQDDVSQANSAIGGAQDALKKLMKEKDEANKQIDNLEEDLEHAQATISAMTQEFTQAREQYETKIDRLMAGLTAAQEVHASRSTVGSGGSVALTRSEHTTAKSKYSSWRNKSEKTIDENTPYKKDNSSGVQSSYTQRGLSVDVENMTIASELTDNESLRYSSRRTKSTGRSRSVGRAELRSLIESDTDSKSVSSPPKSGDSGLSNIDRARSLLKGASRSRSRSRPRMQSSNASVESSHSSRGMPQDREYFNDDASRGGESIYNDAARRSSSKGFGGQFDGDLNTRGERHGFGTFVADNGNEYEGEWKNDKREGHGKAKYNTGDVYIGDWRKCKRHGHGTMYIENGDIYEGGWSNGFKDGVGKYIWRDGEVDVSRYSSDYRVGEGARWSDDGQRAFRLIRGEVQEEISLREAERIADSLGLPVPT